MKRYALRFVMATLLLLALTPVWAQEYDEFTTVAVQFEVSEALFTETEQPLEAFANEVERIVQEATLSHDAALVVFPEYINVFLLAANDLELIRRASSLEEATRLLLRRYEVSTVNGLLRRRARELNGKILNVWRDLAAEYEVAIIPGTFFWAHGSAAGMPSELTNRVIVLGESGEIIYRQDKVFLTPEEEKIFELAPGEVVDAHPFEIAGTTIAVTICRDSYFSEWDPHLGQSDLWIDLRANGEPYTETVRARFRGTLAERVAWTNASAGINASLTGTFLDLLWEGPSYAVDAEGRRISESPRYDESSLVVATLYPSEGEVEAIAVRLE